MMTLLVEFLNIPVSLSAVVKSIFLLGIKIFFAQRGEVIHIFKSFCFLKEIKNFLFTNLVKGIICLNMGFVL